MSTPAPPSCPQPFFACSDYIRPGNEVTDDTLGNAFRKYSSFAKAKVGKLVSFPWTSGVGRERIGGQTRQSALNPRCIKISLREYLLHYISHLATYCIARNITQILYEYKYLRRYVGQDISDNISEELRTPWDVPLMDSSLHLIALPVIPSLPMAHTQSHISIQTQAS